MNGTAPLPISLPQYLSEQQALQISSSPCFSVDHDLRYLIEAVASVCQKIAALVIKGSLCHVLGNAGSENVQGEAQKKLDVIANTLLLEGTQWGGWLTATASEEMDVPCRVPDAYPKGEYLLLFDPLDGSSNIDVDVSIGTIFSVLKCPKDADFSGDAALERAFLQPGVTQVAAGYVIYGPQTLLVLTLGNGVSIFTLDRESGSFILTQANVRIPEETQEFAINMSNQRHWDLPIQHYIADLLQGREGTRGKDFNMRWVASMVADVHRIMMRGGIFMYPLDAKIRAKGETGRLRLMYEANPMAWLVEQAGGAASTGTKRILEIQPTRLHQRVPVILGSKNEVETAVAYHYQA